VILDSLKPYLTYIKVGVAVLVLGAVAWYSHHQGYETGKAKIQAKWDDDRAKVRDAADKQAAKALADEEAARAHNDEVIRGKDAQIAAIAADNQSLSGIVRDYQNRLRSSAMSQATGQRGLDVAAGIASRSAEADRLYDEYDKACRRDAVRFSALQDQIRGQL
jgi:hypothetical protein